MGLVNPRLIIGEGTPEADWQDWFETHPLPVHELPALIGGAHTLVVVAPHPDDEILGCGGMLRQASRLGIEIRIIAVTDGEASHPGSSRWTSESLRTARADESSEALKRLGIRASRERLSIADGMVSQHESHLTDRLMQTISPGDAVISPWRLDGHPDHEAVGRASLRAAAARGGRLLEVPIWGWHWARPARRGFPWHRAASLPLDPHDQQAKAAAVDAFSSQLGDDPTHNCGPVLPAFALARLLRSFEVVLR